MELTRRSFLQGAAAATAASATSGILHRVFAETSVVKAESSLNKYRGRVAINFNKDAVINPANKQCNAGLVETMVDETIMALTDKNDEGEAWKDIFPASLTATSKIAIKTNFYALPISPPPEALLGIVKGLRKMSIGGNAFTGDITIYEANTNNSFQQAGYDSSVFGTDDLKVNLLKATMSSGTNPAQGESKYATILDQVDFLINVFSARGHNDYAEKLSLGFKSHYGSYSNESMATIHSTPGYSQRVRNLHCTGIIPQKQVLSVSCAFYCNNEGDAMGSTSVKPFTDYVVEMDPDATCESPSTIIMSTDAVSCEMQALKILRLNKKAGYGKDSMPKYLRASAGIEGVLDGGTYNIGEIDEEKMDIREIINGAAVTRTAPGLSARSTPYLQRELQVSVLFSQGITRFEYIIPSYARGESVLFSVNDLQGRLLYSKKIIAHGARNRFSWNQVTTTGAKIGHGKYLAVAKTGSSICSTTFIV